MEVRDPLDIFRQRQIVSTQLQRRSALLEQIGTGQVQVGESWDTTLKVGRARRSVSNSINRYQQIANELDRQIDGFSRAATYDQDVALRQKQLAEMAELHAGGHLSDEVLASYQAEYAGLLNSRQTDPYLRQGLEWLKEQEERAQEVPAVPSVTTPKVEEQPEIPQFALPNGEVVSGKIAQILTLLNGATHQQIARRDDLMAILFPGIEPNLARRRFSVQMVAIRRIIEGSSEGRWRIIGEGTTTSEFGYYIQKNGEE